MNFVIFSVFKIIVIIDIIIIRNVKERRFYIFLACLFWRAYLSFDTGYSLPANDCNENFENTQNLKGKNINSRPVNYLKLRKTTLKMHKCSKSKAIGRAKENWRKRKYYGKSNCEVQKNRNNEERCLYSQHWL